jgi:hypothetical protein
MKVAKELLPFSSSSPGSRLFSNHPSGAGQGQALKVRTLFTHQPLTNMSIETWIWNTKGHESLVTKPGAGAGKHTSPAKDRFG